MWKTRGMQLHCTTGVIGGDYIVSSAANAPLDRRCTFPKSSRSIPNAIPLEFFAMLSDEPEEAWAFVEKDADDASEAFANASMLHLKQGQPRQALQSIRISCSYLALRTIARLGIGPTPIDRIPVSEGPQAMRTFADDHADVINLHPTMKEAETNLALAYHDADGTTRVEPRQIPSTVTETLHGIFYGNTVLPCDCRPRAENVWTTPDHTCALRLNGEWDNLGDQRHLHFDSIIALDEGYTWNHIQFQIPRTILTVPQELRPREQALDGLPLNDFCEILHLEQPNLSTPLRLEYPTVYELWPVFVKDSPANQRPTTVAEALRGNLLSARSKIHLAFVLSKSFWQFYRSNWMHSVWSFETLLLPPQAESFRTLNLEAEAPYLRICGIPEDRPRPFEHEETVPLGERRRMHPYPYLMNLCLLLVLLCDTESPSPAELENPNAVYYFCANRIQHLRSDWPSIELSEPYRQRYKKIVQYCLPQPGQRIGLGIQDRHQMLMDNVYDQQKVEAGFKVLLKISGAWKLFMYRPSSVNWLEDLTNSQLHSQVLRRYKATTVVRPKIAVIDTGYDPTASFLRNPQKNRLSPNYVPGHVKYHWKDFWGKSPGPLDTDGHGTSMLSLLMRIAPFADICVARIAGTDKDIQLANSAMSQQRLADAIGWAVEVHEADIISLSLGWEHEYTFEDKYVVRDAISRAISARGQKILFFASASNFGGAGHELFPARVSQVFSIRSADALGKHSYFNASLPEEEGTKVYGTLGEGVPAAQMGRTEQLISRTGTSPATAVAAALATLLVGHINLSSSKTAWAYLKTRDGFQRLMHELSTEPEARKRFLTLENVFNNLADLDILLDKDPISKLNPTPSIITGSGYGKGKKEHEGHASVKLDLSAKIYEVFGGQAEARSSNSLRTIYEFDKIVAKYFQTNLTKADAKKLRDTDAEVKGALSRGPVYVISGLKIAKGLKYSNKRTEDIGGSMGAYGRVTKDASVKADLEGDKGGEDLENYTVIGDTILAYRLHIIKKEGFRWLGERDLEVKTLDPGAAGFMNRNETLSEKDVDIEEVTAKDAKYFAEDEEYGNVEEIKLKDGEEDWSLLSIHQ
ncbi:putative subtilisin [Stagonosporopsis vannaccii]|nr:putative subtilisin [Stagonosporopsis vannaccii]